MLKYAEACRRGSEILAAAGIEESTLDARLLLEYVCDTDRNYLYAHGDRELKEFQERVYLEYIDKRATGIPLQHITGCQEFMGLSFKVNENVLVPRQDTEILVEEALIAVEDGERILDMCTGSGCILLSVMSYKNNIVGVGADISPAALEVAKENYVNLKKRINGTAEFIQSDMFKQITGKFDVILSNPPYIETAVIDTLAAEVKDHDPYIALDGGADGLDFYRNIAENAALHLNAEGRLMMEIGYNQADNVSTLLHREGFRDIKIIRDLAGFDRVVSCRL